MDIFQKGDRVTRVTGKTELDGVVVGAIRKNNGSMSYDVEHPGGFIVIYDQEHLRPYTTERSQYLALVRRVLEHGESRDDRTGVGTRSLFGERVVFDLRDGFPLLTTKKVNFKAVVAELLWMLRGQTNVKDLHEHGVHIWDPWAGPDGDLGPIYGAQWRRWECDGYFRADQIAEAQRLIREDPTSRRILVNSWNVGRLGMMKLPPCHFAFQFNVRDTTWLDCAVTMRSSDVLLGLPFNIAQYALLTELMAACCGLSPGKLTMSLGDTHIYRNHYDQMCTQLQREPRRWPQIRIARHDARRLNVWDFEHDDIVLEDYDPHPAIKGEIAV
jgi:thymidylate synthase